MFVGFAFTRMCVRLFCVAFATPCELAQQAQALLNRLRVPLVLTEAFLQRAWVEVEVQGHPREAERALRCDLAEEPLARAANYVALTVCSSERITDRPSEHCRKKISFRLNGGRYLSLIFGQELVRRIAHTLTRSPVCTACLGFTRNEEIAVEAS